MHTALNRDDQPPEPYREFWEQRKTLHSWCGWFFGSASRDLLATGSGISDKGYINECNKDSEEFVY